ncbi:hypothetical protein ACIPMU_10815 [Streptomyces cyaneofuscatus]|uniref:hypothetical protein n=1 Tax=Streptomyces cyaneofuscatus TaxID=66883 RepID=UPI0037F8FA80
MLYQVTTDTDAETGVGIDGVGVWHERLGWAYGLIASDPAVRAVALVRLADAERNTRDALDRYYRTCRRAYSLRRKAAHRNYEEIRKYSLPEALWDRPAGPDIVAWPGLPYALLFLEFEARYPQEWTRHAKAWGTKQDLIRDVAAAHHDETVRTKLADLIEIVVQRPYRCKDREYVRAARAVDGDDLRTRLKTAARSDNPWAQRHAGYILWLLDRPEVPNTRHVWRTWLAAASGE